MRILLLFVATTCLSFWLSAQVKTISVNGAIKTGKPKDLLQTNVGPDLSPAGFTDCGVSAIRTQDYYGPCDYWHYTVGYIDTSTWIFNSAYDPTIPSSYNWAPSDIKIDSIVQTGIEPYFRLGISWQNAPGVPNIPPYYPADTEFNTFAEICRRTVMHYTEGWDNGRYYQIPYWEIWNEPDFTDMFWDGPNGTAFNYFKLYHKVSDTIKSLNPALKVGGPGLSYNSMYFDSPAFFDDFVAYCDANNLALDFFSWHLYDVKNPYSIKVYGDTVRNVLMRNHYPNAESHISEIHPDLYGTDYSNTPLGASWLISAFITCNEAFVDKFFWYRGTVLHPLAHPDVAGNPNLTWNGDAYKMYHHFLQHTDSTISTTGNEVVADTAMSEDTNFMSLGGISTNGDTLSVLVSNLLTSYDSVMVHFENIPWNGAAVVRISTLSPGIQFVITESASTVVSGVADISLNQAAAPSAFLIQIFPGYLGVGDYSDNTMIVYPNPAEDYIVIQRENSNKASLSISDMNGKTVYSEELTTTTTRINIDFLEPGMYVVKTGNTAKTIEIQ